MNFIFWNLDIGWKSYEFCFSLPISSYPCLFFFYFLISCFWTTPLTLYPFKFLLSLILEPFISCFILRCLCIQCIFFELNWLHNFNVPCMSSFLWHVRFIWSTILFSIGGGFTICVKSITTLLKKTMIHFNCGSDDLWSNIIFSRKPCYVCNNITQ